MKHKLVFLVALLLLSIGSLQAQVINENITIHQADSLIKARTNDKNFVILDIRTDMEFKRSHLENAVQVNWLEKSGKREMRKLDKEKAYLIYCRSGKRSKDAFTNMKKKKFKEVYNMVGGLRAWTKSGYPVIGKDPQFPGPDSKHN